MQEAEAFTTHGKQGYYYDVLHPVTGKPCTPPLMGYRFPEESMRLLIAQDKIIYGEDENKIIELKQRLRDYEDKLSSVISLDSRSGANIIRSLFDNKNVFKNPKTPHIFEEILPFIIGDNDIVLDFFSGSATTAHAVMNMNISDNGNRRYIMIQLPETLKKDSEGAKAGFSTIDQIGMERIIRAARKIKQDYSDATADLGFRHYTLAELSSTTLDKFEQFSPDDNGMFITNTILGEFGIATVLATWLVRDGYGFAAPVETVEFAGYTGYYMGKHLYLIDQNLSNEAITSITEKFELDGAFNPENVVLFGYSFKWTEMEALKTNLARLKDTEKNLRINFDIRY